MGASDYKSTMFHKYHWETPWTMDLDAPPCLPWFGVAATGKSTMLHIVCYMFTDPRPDIQRRAQTPRICYEASFDPMNFVQLLRISGLCAVCGAQEDLFACPLHGGLHELHVLQLEVMCRGERVSVRPKSEAHVYVPWTVSPVSVNSP
jgi:hypothetical protein